MQIFVDADACPVVGIIETMAKLKEGAQSGSIKEKASYKDI